MSDLDDYIKERAERDPEFAESFETGYRDFRARMPVRQKREKAGLTQEDVAKRLRARKSSMSRIENFGGGTQLQDHTQP